jgi:hypothetical protein
MRIKSPSKKHKHDWRSTPNGAQVCPRCGAMRTAKGLIVIRHNHWRRMRR